MNFNLIERVSSNLMIFRDDLFPFIGGGNKARKIMSIVKEIQKKNFNAVVTTGGVQSNHCRAASLACAYYGWKCVLVIHGSRQSFYKQSGNAKMMRLSGAEIKFVNPDEIASVMNDSMISLKNEGYSPYYLYGGGHNKIGVKAYISATHELQKQWGNDGPLDHIFLASGTGSTQAGILLGLENLGWSRTKVHGISIARNKELGEKGIKEAVHFIDRNFDCKKIELNCDYVFGGYGKYNNKLLEFIDDVAKKTGIILDPVYTGKAFFGMIDIVKKKNLKGNILFWHTGGLLNLMA